MRDIRLTNFSFPALSATVSRPTLRSSTFFNFTVSVYYLISLTLVPACISFVRPFVRSFARSLIHCSWNSSFPAFSRRDDGFFLTMQSIRACSICMMNTSASSAAFVKNKCRTNVLWVFYTERPCRVKWKLGEILMTDSLMDLQLETLKKYQREGNLHLCICNVIYLPRLYLSNQVSN